MIAGVIVLLVAALIWAVHELRERIKDLDSAEFEIKSLRREIAKLNPSHPMCRCVLLPIEPAKNEKLVGYGIPHVIREGGVIEISLASLTFLQSETWKHVARHDFDVSEDPSRPGVAIVSEKIRG